MISFLKSEGKKKRNTEEIFTKNINNTVNSMKYDKTSDINKLCFENILYKGCDFDSLSFENVRFSKTIFINCNFENCKFIDCKVSFFNNLIFENSFLHRSSFINCKLDLILIINCRLKSIRITNSSFHQAFFCGNCYYSVEFTDNCNLSGANFIRSSGWLDITFRNENSYTKMDYKTNIIGFDYKDTHHTNGNKKVDVIDSTKELDISNTFMSFGYQFKINNLEQEYGDCFYESKVSKHKTLKGFKKIKSLLAHVSCGYGEKPGNSIIVFLVTVFISAITYMFTGIEMPNGNVLNYNLNLSESIFSMDKLSDFLYCIDFSIKTFTTIGDGDTGTYGVSTIISKIEIVIGVVTIALFTGTLFRKMVR